MQKSELLVKKVIQELKEKHNIDCEYGVEQIDEESVRTISWDIPETGDSHIVNIDEALNQVDNEEIDETKAFDTLVMIVTKITEDCRLHDKFFRFIMQDDITVKLMKLNKDVEDKELFIIAPEDDEDDLSCYMVIVNEDESETPITIKMIEDWEG